MCIGCTIRQVYKTRKQSNGVTIFSLFLIHATPSCLPHVFPSDSSNIDNSCVPMKSTMTISQTSKIANPLVVAKILMHLLIIILKYIEHPFTSTCY